jgi:hypothetical protein
MIIHWESGMTNLLRISRQLPPAIHDQFGVSLL